MFMSKKLSFGLLVFLLWNQLPQALALSLEDQDAIAAVDTIEQTPPDKASLEKFLMPVMEKAAVGIKQNPLDFRQHFILARAYERLGLEELAGSEYNTAEKSGLPFETFALETLKKKVLASQFGSAMTYYQFAKKFYPKDSSVLITSAIQLHKEGKLDEEEALLKGLVSSGKLELGVLTALGSLRLEKLQFEEALKLFDKDLEQNPSYEPALLGKAKTLEQTGRYGSSLAIVIPLYLKDPYRSGLAALVANCFCHLDKYKLAVKPGIVSLAVARTVTEMDQAKSRMNLIWRMVPPAERAPELFSVFALLDRTVYGARMHFALGSALQQAGFMRDAELQFKLGLSMEPDHSSAYLHLADIYQNYYHNRRSTLAALLAYILHAPGDTKVLKRAQRLRQEETKERDIALRIKDRVYLPLTAPKPVKRLLPLEDSTKKH